ncbi:uncharacterized protein LOC128276944, partial [Anopheles cruzii]|uniref:uncharacterized protein LOC128276936 n=1 Tax=Anopheles cruzii TaxID=68878 RepID=UPI0022EC6E06
MANGSYVRYTPCHCPEGDHLRQQSDGLSSKQKRYKSTRRIDYLARPRYVHAKFSRHAVVPRRQETEIVRSYKEPYASRRIQQLALPRVRNLFAVHEEYQHLLAPKRQEQLKKKIKQSSTTIYSQLAGVELPKINGPKGMSPDEWQRHKDWLELRDYQVLSSLSFSDLKKIPFVKPAALKATASERTIKLAEPIERRRRAKGKQVEET